MSPLDGAVIDTRSFAYRDILGLDEWDTFTVSFTSLTTVGALTTSGRYRIVGKECQFQVSFSAATSIASTAGTTYMSLPITAKGLAGLGVMTNDTAKTAVGTCHVDVTNSRLYLPTQGASGNSFTLCGSFEIG